MISHFFMVNKEIWEENYPSGVILKLWVICTDWQLINSICTLSGNVSRFTGSAWDWHRKLAPNIHAFWHGRKDFCFQKYACNYHENSSHFLETAAYSGNLATDSTMSSYDSWSKKTIFFFFFALMAVVQCVPQFVDMTRTRSNLNPAPILEQFCDILEMVSSKFRTGLLSTRCFFICFFFRSKLSELWNRWSFFGDMGLIQNAKTFKNGLRRKWR